MAEREEEEAGGGRGEGGGGGGGGESVEELKAEVSRLKALLAVRAADKRTEAWQAAMRKANALASQRQLLTGDWRANELPRVTKCGFMSKRKSRPQAHLLQYRRFFVLVGNLLYYYKKPEDSEPRGSIMLAGCSVRIVSPAERCMEVDSPASGKAYYMFADTETQLDEWAAAISEASIMRLRVDAPAAASAASATAEQQLSEAERRSRADGFMAVLLGELRDAERPVPAEHAAMARQVVGDPVGVRAFTEAMNRERSQPELRLPDNFGRLCEIVNAALLTAYETDDFARARALLNMSNTFYLTSAKQPARRVYVMRHVANHKIWVSLRTWEGIFFEAVTAESRRHVTGDGSVDGAAAAPEPPGPLEVEELIDRMPREERKNIVFGQLLSFANEMINFNLSYSTCSHFVMALSIANDMSEEQRKMLFDHLNGLYSAKYGGKKR